MHYTYMNDERRRHSAAVTYNITTTVRRVCLIGRGEATAVYLSLKKETVCVCVCVCIF